MVGVGRQWTIDEAEQSQKTSTQVLVLLTDSEATLGRGAWLAGCGCCRSCPSVSVNSVHYAIHL